MSFDQPDPIMLDILEFALTNNGKLAKGHKIYQEIVNLKLVCRKWRDLLNDWMKKHSYIIYTSIGILQLIYHPNVFYIISGYVGENNKFGIPVYPKKMKSPLRQKLDCYGAMRIVIKNNEYGYFLIKMLIESPEYKLFKKN